MTTVKVYAPNEAYAGTVGDIRFEGGIAEVDKAHPSMRYFERKGYGIGSRPKAEAALPADKLEPTRDGEPVDARDFGASVPFGSPLRDAAVDPKPGDFLPPTNAGSANPHGPRVVSPEIHASGPAGIKPGNVHVDDTDRQAAEETNLAEEVLVEGRAVTTVASAPEEVNRGPLGLSDPGSVEAGVEGVAAAETPKPSTKAAGPKGKSK